MWVGNPLRFAAPKGLPRVIGLGASVGGAGGAVAAYVGGGNPIVGGLIGAVGSSRRNPGLYHWRHIGAAGGVVGGAAVPASRGKMPSAQYIEVGALTGGLAGSAGAGMKAVTGSNLAGQIPAVPGGLGDLYGNSQSRRRSDFDLIWNQNRNQNNCPK